MSRHARRGTNRSVAAVLACATSAMWLAAPGAAVPDARGQTVPVASDAAVMPPLAQVVRLEVQPAAMALADSLDTRTILVTGVAADGSVRDVTREARFQSSDPAVAAVDARGRVTPVGIGTAAVVVEIDGADPAAPLRAQVAVEVRSAAARPVSFRNDVMPILARAGCNSGACHGAAAGRNGFKLSLLGYDPAGDLRALTHDQASRRLDRLNPAQSLFLLKPLGAVPHQGGQRFTAESLEYRLLREWVEAGVPSDLDTAAALESIEVFPDYRVLAQPGLSQQLQVTASYSDGSLREVTHWARYASTNETVAEVDDGGLVFASRRGEAAVTVNYGGQVAVSRLMVLEPDPDFQWSDPPVNNFIDELVFAKLRDMHTRPSELCSDEEFIRRVYLDVLGIPPTPEEVRAFLAESSDSGTGVSPVERRSRLIDELLVRPEYANVWGVKWSDLLGIRTENPAIIPNPFRGREVWQYYRWLRDAFATNMPYDRFVRELLTGSGSTHTHAAANYYRRYRSVEELTESTAQLFFGVRLRCARCHDHPFERWNQRDYYSFAAFFSQVRTKPGDGFLDAIVYAEAVPPQAEHPNTGEQLGPAFLGGERPVVSPDEDARYRLAEWLTSPENPYFARAFVNRVWSYYFGRGIVDPVDDLRVSNPPSNEALLDALERDFIESGFDVRHLVRTILNSRTYQLAARTNETNADDTTNFSHFYPRRLSAEQLVDSLAVITGVAEQFETYTGGPDKEPVYLPEGVMVLATMLPDGNVRSRMLNIFGRPAREDPCECERTNESSLTQALALINGEEVHRRVTAPDGWVMQAAAAMSDDRRLVEELYLRVLSRLPSEQEYAIGTSYLAEAADRGVAAQDLVWALLNSREFIFQH